MGEPTRRLLPLPSHRMRGARSWPLFLAGGGMILAAPVFLMAWTGGMVPEVIIVYGVMYGAPLIGAALYMLHQLRKYQATLAENRQIALSAGLSFEERVREDDLEPFEDFTLFRITWPRASAAWSLDHGGASMRRAACNLFRGRFDGREVLAFEYEYLGRPSSRDKRIRRVQLVVILPNVGLPEFDAGPRHHDWDEHWPGWADRARLGRVVVEMDTIAVEPTVVRARDEEAVAGLFSRRRIKRLGSLSECCVESVGGHLLFYAPDVDVPASGVPRAIARAVEVAGVLTTPEDELRARRDAIQATPPEPPATADDGRFRDALPADEGPPGV